MRAKKDSRLTNQSQPTPKDDRRKTDRRKPPRPAASVLIWYVLGFFVLLAVLGMLAGRKRCIPSAAVSVRA